MDHAHVFLLPSLLTHLSATAQHPSYFLSKLCSAAPGATISDEEDMPWGEQAQLAIEQEAGFRRSLGGRPKPDRHSAVGPNHMRCLPEEEDCWLSSSARTKFLGKSLQQQRRSTGRLRCRAVPSCHGCHNPDSAGQVSACLTPVDIADQSNCSISSGSSCRLQASSGESSSGMHIMRGRRQQQQGGQLQCVSTAYSSDVKSIHSRHLWQLRSHQQHSMHSRAQSMHSSRQGSAHRHQDGGMHCLHSVQATCPDIGRQCGLKMAADSRCQPTRHVPPPWSQQRCKQSSTRSQGMLESGSDTSPAGRCMLGASQQGAGSAPGRVFGLQQVQSKRTGHLRHHVQLARPLRLLVNQHSSSTLLKQPSHLLRMKALMTC